MMGKLASTTRWEALAREVLSQLTTAACGVLLGIATAPRAPRAALSKALVLLRRLGPSVCTYGKALVELPPQPADGACVALLTCANEAWHDDAIALPHARTLLATCALLACSILVRELSRDGASGEGTATAAPPPPRGAPAQPTGDKSKPARAPKRDSRRYVSVEYEALVASTSLACKASS